MSAAAAWTGLVVVGLFYVLLVTRLWLLYRESEKRCLAQNELLELARRQQLDAQFSERMQAIELRRHVFTVGRGVSKDAWLN